MNLPTCPPAHHLDVTTSGRGLRFYPTLVETYGKTGVYVSESSAASGPHVWVRILETSGYKQAAHLTVEQAVQLAEQLLHCVEHHYQLLEPPSADDLRGASA